VRLADISILTAAMRQREQALQLLTHDMRSPQTSILAMLATTPDLPPELSERMAAYAKRTLALADGFVQLARAEVTPGVPGARRPVRRRGRGDRRAVAAVGQRQIRIARSAARRR
jgi:signal transduction histidine kinase